MLYKDYTREFIGFEDVIVTFAERKDNQFHIHMKMKRKAHECPRCGRITEKIHDYREQRIKDISSFGSYTFIHLRKRRYVCPSCNKRTYIASFPQIYESIASKRRYILNLLFSVIVNLVRSPTTAGTLMGFSLHSHINVELIVLSFCEGNGYIFKSNKFSRIIFVEHG